MEAELASLNLRFSELAETLDVVNFREAREFKANPDSANSAQKKIRALNPIGEQP